MNWPLRTLDEIFEIARGGSPRPIDQFITDADDGVNWIMIGDASNSSKHIRETKKKIKPSGVSRSRLVKPGDFLLTNSMSFGRPYILDTHGCIHDGWLVLSPRRANVDHDYFYHLLGSPAIFGQFEKLAAGATVKNLNIDLVKSVVVALPPLEEQKRIAAILDQADELRRKRQRALDRLNQLGQAIFIEMFGDPKTEISRWDTVGFPEACDDQTSKSEKLQRGDYLAAGEFPVVDQGQSFVAGWSDDASMVCKSQGPVIVFGDHTRAVKYVDFPFVIGADGAKVLVPKARFNVRYFAELLKRLPIPNLGYSRHMREVKRIQFMCPPRALQDEFSVRLTALADQISIHEKSKSRFEGLFVTLQHRAFRGEL